MHSNVISDLGMAGYSESSSGTKKLIDTGKNAVICCIFHNEDTPSLSISKDGRGFKCFGCGHSGHYSEIQRLLLPEIYGRDNQLISNATSHNRKLQNSLHSLTSAAANKSKDKDQAAKLGTINSFESNTNIMVPWSEDWRGFSGEFLQTLGVKHWVSREIDYESKEFIEVPRAMFPFKHPRFDLTIGYAARRLVDDDPRNPPKYRNSSLIPTKEILYMYNLLPPRAPVVITEGATDAVKLAYYGIPAVASLGTNQWSDFKTRLILKKRPSMILALGDGDEAGRKFNQVLHMHFRDYMSDTFYIEDLPDGLDPGSFDQQWIEYIWNNINQVTNNQLSKLNENGNFLFQTQQDYSRALLTT